MAELRGSLHCHLMITVATKLLCKRLLYFFYNHRIFKALATLTNTVGRWLPSFPATGFLVVVTAGLHVCPQQQLSNRHGFMVKFFYDPFNLRS